MTGEILRVLAAAAREAGDRLLALQADKQVIARRASGDLTLAADEGAQDLILGRLARELPDLAVVAEEGDRQTELPPTFLTVDPLDGTIPYSLGCPDWGVNLGYVRGGQPVGGAIYLPATGQLLKVDADAGCCYLNECPVTLQGIPAERFVLGLDLHYATDPEFVRSVLVPLIPQVRLTRSLGSTAALSVDFALGRTDAHLNLRGGDIWDIATLGAIAAAYGYPISDLAGRPRNWRDRSTAIVTSCNPSIFAQILLRTRAFVAGATPSEP